jgi:hypothetical protein
MSGVTCISGSTLVGEECLTRCPRNFEILSTDTSMCVSNVACPMDTTEVDGDTCQKSNTPAVDGACSAGQAQLQPGICFYPSPCPAPFLENGIYCLKRKVERVSTSPYCSNSLYSYANGNCSTLSMYAWLIIIFGVFVVILILVLFYGQASNCSPRRYLRGGTSK